ncbi:hypothetical protein CUMW_280130 [Citrus unshiu]|uniref:Uncharacterized protein n=1 Tax=Citrus unshiu TaxID=55188 RepID=A0A2H5N9L1_CITUN|nr:hypothetical protein CUMW_280130 [Citrus unshiu]
MLCSGFNVVGFNWLASPVATELESIVMDWMGKMLKLPSSFLFSGNRWYVVLPEALVNPSFALCQLQDKALEKLEEALTTFTKLIALCLRSNTFRSPELQIHWYPSSKLFRPLRHIIFN